MRLDILQSLNAERAARRAAIVITDIASGEQRFLRAQDVAADPLCDRLEARLRNLPWMTDEEMRRIKEHSLRDTAACAAARGGGGRSKPEPEPEPVAAEPEPVVAVAPEPEPVHEEEALELTEKVETHGDLDVMPAAALEPAALQQVRFREVLEHELRPRFELLRGAEQFVPRCEPSVGQRILARAGGG